MDYINQLLVLENLCSRIKKGKTGSQSKLAETLHIGERTLRRRIEDLRSLGAIIQYDKIQCTYYFVNEFDFSLTITVKDSNQGLLRAKNSLSE